MKHLAATFILLLAALGAIAQNQIPVISNFVIQPDIAGNTASLQYDLSDAEGDLLDVTVQFSTDGGKTFGSLSGANVTGDVGFPVVSGSRMAFCSGLNFVSPGKYAFRILANDLQPFDIQTLVNEVDSNRLRQDLIFLEGIRHRTGGLVHLNETRDSLQRFFENAGLFFENQTFSFTNTTGRNLIGSLCGTESVQQVVIVDAHYDTVINAPGADDNGSGVVGMMEIARILSRYPSKKTQRYIGFDLEESGLIGSTRYVTTGIPAGEQVAGVFNFEMIGYWSDQPNSQSLPTGFGLLFPLQAQAVADNLFRGDFITNVGNTNSQPLALLFSNAAQQYAPALKVITLDVPGNGNVVPDLRRSDHTPFWEAGKQALMLTDGANFRNECYHTAGDTLEDKLNFTFMSNVVKATLAAMATLVEVQHADWATVSFELAGSAASEPNSCGFRVIQNGGLFLHSDECFSEEISIELYDMKGALMSQQTAQIPSNGMLLLPLANQTSGVYALNIRHKTGVFSQKVIIP